MLTENGIKKIIAKIFSLVFLTTLITSCTLTNLIVKTEGTPDVHLNYSGMSMTLMHRASQVDSVAFSSNGRYVVAGSFDKTLRVWDTTAGKLIRAFEGASGALSKGTVSSVALSPDGKYAISGGGDATVKVWDIDTGDVIKTFQESSFKPVDFTKVIYVAVTPDNRRAVSVANNTLSLWDISSGKEIKSFNLGGFSNRVKAAALSPDARRVLSGDLNGTVSLWDVETGKLERSLEASSGIMMKYISSVAFSSDGKFALSGGADMMIRLWDIETGRLVRTIKGGESQYGVQSYLSVAISPDNRFILSGTLGTFPKLWDVSTGAEMRQFKGDVSTFTGANGVSQVAFSPDGRIATAALWDGSVRMWDLSSGEEVAVMIGFEDNEWLLITADGYYNTSPRGDRYLGVGIDREHYTVEQFYDVFYRPDIVSAKLQGADIKDLVTITMQDAIKTPPPIVEVADVKDSDSPKVKFCIKVKNTGGGIGEVRLFHNGKLIQSDGYYKEISRSTSDKTQLAILNSKAIYADMRSVSIKNKADTIPISTKPKGDLFEDCKEIDAIQGDNEVSIAAFNASNTVQSYMKTINFHSSTKSEDPHLYILAIGIDQYSDNTVNLQYAVKDAKDLEEKLKIQSATLYEPKNIHYTLLTDKEATKTNITNKINELSKIIKSQDSFILFVAGHGVLLQNQYYLLTHDFNGQVSKNSMISSNEIVEASKKIKSLSQLFIFDTCHAGGVDTIISGLYDARMSVLAKKMGLHIYASANDKQTAMDGYKGNGLFTYTLLDGLNNNRQADKNKDGKVSIVGLGEYSKKLTSNISKQIGHEQTPLIINFGKDSPIYRLQ
jgi:WD40 repeat protein